MRRESRSWSPDFFRSASGSRHKPSDRALDLAPFGIVARRRRPRRRLRPDSRRVDLLLKQAQHSIVEEQTHFDIRIGLGLVLRTNRSVVSNPGTCGGSEEPPRLLSRRDLPRNRLRPRRQAAR
jgi:hypothetical protein